VEFDSRGKLAVIHANRGVENSGCGTVFKFSAGHKESVLYNFRGQSDGGLPTVGVVEDSNHNLYGITE
jgi:hypothetical protein